MNGIIVKIVLAFVILSASVAFSVSLSGTPLDHDIGPLPGSAALAVGFALWLSGFSFYLHRVLRIPVR